MYRSHHYFLRYRLLQFRPLQYGSHRLQLCPCLCGLASAYSGIWLPTCVWLALQYFVRCRSRRKGIVSEMLLQAKKRKQKQPLHTSATWRVVLAQWTWPRKSGLPQEHHHHHLQRQSDRYCCSRCLKCQSRGLKQVCRYFAASPPLRRLHRCSRRRSDDAAALAWLWCAC